MNRARVLTPALVLILVAAIVAFFVSTSGGSTKTSPPAGTAGSAVSAVSVARTSLGPVLVDGKGRTLYLFEGDRPNRSTLSAAGFAIWPAFTAAGTPRALNGAVASRIGTITGSGQITYSGHPLYYYVGDQKAGQTTGQGLNQFGALWYVVSPQGNAVIGAPKSSIAGGAPATGSGGAAGSTYGY